MEVFNYTLKNVYPINMDIDLSLLDVTLAKSIDNSDIILFGPMVSNLDVSTVKVFLNSNKKIVIDGSHELIEELILKFLDNFEDLSKFSYYCIPRYEQYCINLKQKLLKKNLTLVEKNFFILNSSKYQPIFSKNDFLPKKIFCSLNGKITPHRTLMISLLSYYNLLDYGYVSFFNEEFIDKNFSDTKIFDIFNFQLDKNIEKKILIGLKKITLPLVLDVQTMNAKVSHAKQFNADFYSASEFVLVNETSGSFYSDIFFCTEKTTKAILLNKKIIVNANKNFVKKLKYYYLNNMGRDISELTDWCDLAYDESNSFIERSEKIVEIIKNYCHNK